MIDLFFPENLKGWYTVPEWFLALVPWLCIALLMGAFILVSILSTRDIRRREKEINKLKKPHS